MTSNQKIRFAVAVATLAVAIGHSLFSGRTGDLTARESSAERADGTCLSASEQADFDREALFGTWRDEDGDCRNTRAEVLQSNSIEPASGGCSIATGEWYDPYTGDTIRHPKDLDIDHIVPLKEAWLSGAWKWTKEERLAYANDPSVLLAVDKHANRSKGDKDPADWLPPNRDFRAEYARRWASVKIKHHLSADRRERETLRGLGVEELPAEAPEGCVPGKG